MTIKNFHIFIAVWVSISSCKNNVETLSAGKIDSIITKADSILAVNIDPVDTLAFDNLVEIARITKGVNNPKSVVVSPNGLHAYVNNLEGMNTMIINTKTYEIESIIEHTGKPVEFAITDSGRYVWISYFRLLEKGYPKNLGVERNYRYPSVVVVYDTLEMALRHRITVGVIPKVLAVSPDEKLIFVTNWNSDDISVISTDYISVIKTIKVDAIPRGVEFTPDGKYAYVCNFGASTISKINVGSLEVEKTVRNVGVKPRDIVITKDGKYAYFSSFGDGYLRKLDLESDEVINKLKIGIEPRSVCMTRNNRYVFVVNYESAEVDVIDTREFEVIRGYGTDHGSVGVALAPDMRFLWVTNQEAGSIQVFRIEYK